MNDYDSVTDFFKAISDSNRLRILLMLTQRPLCVCEIDAVLDIAVSTTSSHLKQLKNLGLIKSKKDGRWVIYHLAENDVLRNILSGVMLLLQEDHQYLADMKLIKEICRESCKTV